MFMFKQLLQILQLEFAHYDCKLRGTISAKDFALSLVASADLSQVNKLLDRVDEIGNEPKLRPIRITYKEFKDFAELRKQLQFLSLAIFTYGKVNGVLTKRDFQRAASKVQRAFNLFSHQFPYDFFFCVLKNENSSTGLARLINFVARCSICISLGAEYMNDDGIA